jgi:hypothetical protein
LNWNSEKVVAVTFCNRGTPTPGVFVSVADKRVTEAVPANVADKGVTGA